MSDPDPDYQPRENDHLVEPMFAGLGVGEEEEERAKEEPDSRGGWLAALARWWRRRFGSDRG